MKPKSVTVQKNKQIVSNLDRDRFEWFYRPLSYGQ